jgi:Ni2+-binding GTPase involved in maturation of urease and hydrogenase
MVFGSAKSGKTTLLRNIGRIASDQARRHEWNVVTVDFGTRGLDVLRQFPNTVLSANADSLESITRTIRYLELEVARRRGLLAAHACASYEQLIARVPNLPRLLVLVDDFQNFGGAFGGAVLGSQAPEIELGRFIATLSDAGSCGVHYVVGADRRSSVRASMHSAIPARIVLRQGDEMGYFDFGISIARGSIPKLPAGRGFWLDDKRVQFVSDAGDEQETTDRTAGDRAIAVATALPEHIVLEAGQEFPRVVVGVCDVTHELCRHDVSRRPLLVIGPRGSGRSHALRWWMSQANPKHVKHVQSTADLAKVSRGDVIVIDDADVAVNQIEDSAIFAAIREKECHLMFSINARNSNGLGFGWLRDFARDAACLVLQPDDRHSQTALSTFFDRLPYLRPGLEYPAGRGTFSAGRTSVVVQVPQLGEDK